MDGSATFCMKRCPPAKQHGKAFISHSYATVIIEKQTRLRFCILLVKHNFFEDDDAMMMKMIIIIIITKIIFYCLSQCINNDDAKHCPLSCTPQSYFFGNVRKGFKVNRIPTNSTMFKKKKTISSPAIWKSVSLFNKRWTYQLCSQIMS